MALDVASAVELLGPRRQRAALSPGARRGEQRRRARAADADRPHLRPAAQLRRGAADPRRHRARDRARRGAAAGALSPRARPHLCLARPPAAGDHARGEGEGPVGLHPGVREGEGRPARLPRGRRAAHDEQVDAEPADQLAWDEKALAYMEASSQEEAKKWEGSLRNNLGYAYHLAGRYDEAIAQFRLSLAAYERSGRAANARIAHWMIARTLRFQGKRRRRSRSSCASSASGTRPESRIPMSTRSWKSSTATPATASGPKPTPRSCGRPGRRDDAGPDRLRGRVPRSAVAALARGLRVRRRRDRPASAGGDATTSSRRCCRRTASPSPCSPRGWSASSPRRRSRWRSCMCRSGCIGKASAPGCSISPRPAPAAASGCMPSHATFAPAASTRSTASSSSNAASSRRGSSMT